MGPGQAAPGIEKPGIGRSDFDTGELAVARSIARAQEHLTAKTHLLPSLISTTYAFRARRWWKHRPFLPVPEPEYTRWRLFTAYGHLRQRPTWRDITAFALWRQRIRRVVEMRSQ